MALSSCSIESSLEGPRPHQPKFFPFPKRNFGQSKVALRSFQPTWFRSWSWLHYHEVTDTAFCFLCAKAVREKKISSGNTEPTFVSLQLPTDNCFQCHNRYQKVFLIGKMPLNRFVNMRVAAITKKL